MEIVNPRLNIHPFYLYNMPTPDPRPTATPAQGPDNELVQIIQNLHGDDAQQRSRRFIQDLEAAVTTQTPLLDQALGYIETAEARAALQQAQAAIPNPPPPQPAMISPLTNSTPLTAGLAKLLPRGYPMTIINNVSSRCLVGTVVAFVRPHASPNYSEVRDTNLPRQAPFPVLNSSLAAMVEMDKGVMVPHKRKKDIADLIELAESRGWKMEGEFPPTGSVMFGKDKKISWPSLVSPSLAFGVTLSEETVQTVMFILTLGTKPPVDAMFPQSILDIIRNAPGMSRLRGMVLAATKLRLPLDVIAAGSDAMLKWLEDNTKFQPLIASPDATDTSPEMVEVKYELVRKYFGRRDFTYLSSCRGSVMVPSGVVSGGGTPLDDFLWDHANMEGEWKDGNIENGECDDEEDSERYETTIL